MRSHRTRTTATVVIAAALLVTSAAGAAAAPSNKNSGSPGTATCPGLGGPLEITFNRSERTPVSFLAGHRIALARHVEGTFTLQVVQDSTTLAQFSEPFEEEIANGVQPGMQVTECTFDFSEQEETVLTAELIAELNEFANAGLDPALAGETVTFIYMSTGTVVAQIVGRP